MKDVMISFIRYLTAACIAYLLGLLVLGVLLSFLISHVSDREVTNILIADGSLCALGTGLCWILYFLFRRAWACWALETAIALLFSVLYALKNSDALLSMDTAAAAFVFAAFSAVAAVICFGFGAAFARLQPDNHCGQQAGKA